MTITDSSDPVPMCRALCNTAGNVNICLETSELLHRSSKWPVFTARARSDPVFCKQITKTILANIDKDERICHLMNDVPTGGVDLLNCKTETAGKDADLSAAS